MKSRLTLAATIILFATSVSAQTPSPAVPTDSRCTGLTGPALDKCLKASGNQCNDLTGPARETCLKASGNRCAGLTGLALESCLSARVADPPAAVDRSRDTSPDRTSPGRSETLPETPGARLPAAPGQAPVPGARIPAVPGQAPIPGAAPPMPGQAPTK